MATANHTAKASSRRRKPKIPGIYARTNQDGSTTFMAQVRLKGFKPVAKAFQSLPDAEAWVVSMKAELQAQRERGEVRQDLPKLTIKGLIDEFLGDPETQALRYYDAVAYLLGWWVDHYASERVLSFGVLKLREARDVLRSTGGQARIASNGTRTVSARGPATTNRYMSALRSAWNWGRAAGLVLQDRTWPTRLMLTEPRERTRYLSDDELSRLLTAAAEHSPVLSAAVLVAIGTGVRRSELLRIRWADVDFNRATLRVLLSKNGEARAVPLPGAAADALRALKQGSVVSTKAVFLNPDGEPLDNNQLEYLWRQVRVAAGLHDFHWHDLRHTCASILAQNGATLLEIGSVLGHRSASVTKRYAHLVAGRPVTGHAALDAKLRGR